MKTPILLIGGGGHCVSCIEALESADVFRIVGVIDQEAKTGNLVSGYKVVGTDMDLPDLIRKYRHALITVGQIQSDDSRRRLYERLSQLGAIFPWIAASSAVVSSRAIIGAGSVVLHRVVVNAGALVGVNCILNTGCIVEHDVRMGAHTHLSTGACINGGCRIGEGVFIGSNATLVQGVRLTDHVVIGAGSLVRKDVLTAGTYVGNPLRRIG